MKDADDTEVTIFLDSVVKLYIQIFKSMAVCCKHGVGVGYWESIEKTKDTMVCGA